MTNRLARHHDPRADLGSPVEIDHVLIRHADAAGRNRLPDRIRLIGAMDAVERAGEIHGARAERIVRSPLHMARKVWPAPQHLGRRRPIGPFSLVADACDAGPGESRPSDTNAVFEGLMIRQDQVEPALPGADDDGARSLPSVKGDGLSMDRRRHRLQLRIERAGEDRRRSETEKKAGREGGADPIGRMISPVETMTSQAPARFAGDAIMAGDKSDAMRSGESEITNWSIVSDCGEEATSRSSLPHEPRKRRSRPWKRRGTLTPPSTRTSMT